MLGLAASCPPVNDQDNLTTFSNSPIAVCVATMSQQKVTDVPSFVGGLTPLAQQHLLRDYCGVANPVGGWHDSDYFAPHAGGGAFDIEYHGSPWIPLIGKNFNGADTYLADAPKGAGYGTAKTMIYDKCMEVWNRACNYVVKHDATAKCQCFPTGDTTDPDMTTTTVNAIWELSDSVRQYFAQTNNPDVEKDRLTVGRGMVIGSSSYDATANTFSGGDPISRAKALGQPNHAGGSKYSGGVVGFNRVVVKKIHQASLGNPPSPPYPASVPAANPPYPPCVDAKTTRLLQWSVFTFGSDLMHFDICHNGGATAQRTIAIAEVTTCQTFVEAFAAKSDGKNPWSSPGS